jgi:hypothetical protein
LGYLSPPPSPQPVIVYKDVGGLVSEYEAQTEIYRRENREVRLHECRSACTLALSLPNVCVYPDAQVKFHQAYNGNTREADLGVSAQLFDSYPAAVQGRLGYLTRQYKVLSGVELIALGMRNCLRHDDNIMIATKKPRTTPGTVVAAAANPLGDIAQRVKVAVASALERPEDTPPTLTRITTPDRSPVPPTLARLAGAAPASAGSSEIPLPPRRPDFAPPPASEPSPSLQAAASPQLISGAQPILDATRFAPGMFSLRAEAARRNGAAAGG